MHDLFLSYSSADRVKASSIASLASEAGWSVWWDRDIKGGEDWDGSIDHELDQAKVVLVLWSRSSIESDWVRHEAQVARDSGRLLPALLDPVLPPAQFQDIQAVPLTAWIADQDQHDLRPLFTRLAELLDTPTPSLPDPPIQRVAEKLTRIAVAEAVFEFCHARCDLFRLRQVPGGVDQELLGRMRRTYERLAEILAPISNRELHDLLDKHQRAFTPPDQVETH
ncbi:MAG TPA: toll/interleukin-1 receptor domain-containing protein [Steroidobacteraceae bacterium]|nr:toll/interleukin-1 receptor domain-containing protein [Steroidobacteraceae bacterium]